MGECIIGGAGGGGMKAATDKIVMSGAMPEMNIHLGFRPQILIISFAGLSICPRPSSYPDFGMSFGGNYAYAYYVEDSYRSMAIYPTETGIRIPANNYGSTTCNLSYAAYG